MSRLSKIEQGRQIIVPELFKDFFSFCSYSLPKDLVGTDLLNDHADLNEWATELLAEDGTENFLNVDDLVFMMHQGYIFWYFKANGDPDPDVFGYYQGKIKPDNLGRLSEFLKRYRA